MRRYLHGQRRRGAADHRDQRSVHKGLVRQVGQGLHQRLHRLQPLVLDGVLRGQVVSQLRQVLLDVRALLVPNPHYHKSQPNNHDNSSLHSLTSVRVTSAWASLTALAACRPSGGCGKSCSLSIGDLC